MGGRTLGPNRAVLSFPPHEPPHQCLQPQPGSIAPHRGPSASPLPTGTPAPSQACKGLSEPESSQSPVRAPDPLTRRPRTRLGTAGAMLGCAALRGGARSARRRRCVCAESRLPRSPPVWQRSRPVGRVGPRAAAATLITFFFFLYPSLLLFG